MHLWHLVPCSVQGNARHYGVSKTENVKYNYMYTCYITTRYFRLYNPALVLQDKINHPLIRLCQFVRQAHRTHKLEQQQQ